MAPHETGLLIPTARSKPMPSSHNDDTPTPNDHRGHGTKPEDRAQPADDKAQVTPIAPTRPDDRGADPTARHDTGDDKGVDAGAKHDVVDDKGVDPAGTHDVGDDHGHHQLSLFVNEDDAGRTTVYSHLVRLRVVGNRLKLL
jgi:hypothetical protein